MASSFLVDARTSQNASNANSIAIPILVVDTPQLFGQVGLVTSGSEVDLRVVLSGTVTLQLPLALVGITITVVRGFLSTDPLVYSATMTYDLAVLAPQLLSFSAADFNPTPGSGQTAYTAFVSSNLLGSIRVGPECFTAVAYADVEV
jgi:hypothetical protein